MAVNSVHTSGRLMSKRGGMMIGEACVAGPSRIPASPFPARSMHSTPQTRVDETGSSSTRPKSSASKPLSDKELAALEAEEEWSRNLRSVRRWRREQETFRQRFAHLKPSSTQPVSSPQSHLLTHLTAAGAQLGHHPSLLHPSSLPLILGTRSGLSIIDLEQTIPLLRRAAALVREVVRADGVVLFVGTRREHKEIVGRAVGRLEENGFGVGGEGWGKGTLSNSFSYFGIEPIRSRSHLPDLVIFLNPSENLAAIRECTASNIPTIGVIDTDGDLRGVSYGIPANSESIRTLELIVNTLSLAGKAGRKKRIEEAVKKGLEGKDYNPRLKNQGRR